MLKRTNTAKQDLPGMTPVFETGNGTWVKITGPEGAARAGDLSQTGIRMHASAKWDRPPQAGRIWPEYYLLIDDPQNPTRAHVALAAVSAEAHRNGQRGSWIGDYGHAVGYDGASPYPDFRSDIEDLIREEGLQFRHNHLGRVISRAELDDLQSEQVQPEEDDSLSPSL